MQQINNEWNVDRDGMIKNKERRIRYMVERIRKTMLLLLAQKDDKVIREIAEEVMLLYPTYGADYALSKYYDEIVMGCKHIHDQKEDV